MDIVIVRFEEKECHKFNEELHDEIFFKDTSWKSLKQLRKIKDFYKANADFKGEYLGKLIKELNIIDSKINQKQDELRAIIQLLTGDNITNVMFLGD